MSPTRTVPATRPAAGRWLLGITGLVTLVIGSFFVWLLWSGYARAKEMRSWAEAPCTILSSSIEERTHDPYSPREYRFAILFGYEVNGTAFTSDRFSMRGTPWSSQRNKAENLAEEYPAGRSFTCRISPKDPAFAVLKPDSLAPGYTIWFPGLFVAGGLGMVIRAMADPRK